MIENREHWISNRAHALSRSGERRTAAAYDHWYRAAGEFDVLERQPTSPPDEASAAPQSKREAMAAAWKWH